MAIGKTTTSNNRQGLSALSTITGKQEYITSTGGILNSGATLSGSAIPASGLSTAAAVQIVDGSGNQITSFGGGTQYIDGGVVPTHPIAPTLVYDNAGAWQHVSVANPLPVSATISTVGLATSANQTNGTQLTGLVAGSAAIGSITNTSFIVTQATAANLNATIVGTGTFAAQVTGSVTANIGTTNGLALDATQTNGTQQTKITNGTNLADVVSNDTSYNGQVVNNGTKTIPFTTSSSGAQTLIANTDCRGYAWMQIAYTSVGSGLALTAQVSSTSGGTYMTAGNVFTTNTSISGAPATLGTVVSTIYEGPVMGNFLQLVLSALTSGTFTGTLTLSALPHAYHTVGATVAGTVAATQSGTWAMSGPTTSGSSITANPITEGGQAKTANPTAVSDGQVVNATFDKLGKQVVVGSIRDLKVQQQTTITASTSETTVLTAVASTFLDVYGVIIANSSATVEMVTFKDSTAGTTRFTIMIPAGETRGFTLTESAALVQATVNNNWTATCGTSLTNIFITMLAVKNI